MPNFISTKFEYSTTDKLYRTGKRPFSQHRSLLTHVCQAIIVILYTSVQFIIKEQMLLACSHTYQQESLGEFKS